ncbi:hybrid sensor histidine kinase/response regulator [Chloroflexus sp.]|uniref:hybrid sensor histidine kinase/response regulator n=1 Tax=Chloroflexus sp. TaxID=1904827 RepID=UPI0026055670|nr:response regulator [uncultured Chloroflexus sp.]
MEEILIVDDNEQIGRMLANSVLPELGYRATIALTGQGGLDRLRVRQPDLILLDLQLPDMNGLDFLRILTRDGIDIPVILMTAHGSEMIAVEAFRLGARNYLIKPFSDSEARQVIDQALRERRLQRERDRLMALLQQRVQELTVLTRVGKSVTALMDQRQLLDRIVEAAVYITQAEEGLLCELDEQRRNLVLRAQRNITASPLANLNVTDSLIAQALRSGKPLRLSSSTTGEPIIIVPDMTVQATLQVPLQFGDRVIGVLVVNNRRANRPFNESDQYLLAALADYAAIAIENARLYQAARNSEARYRAIFSTASDMILTLDTEWRIVNCNQSGARMLADEADALIGQPLQRWCLPQEWSMIAQTLQRVTNGVPQPPFTVSLQRSTNELAVVEMSAQRLDLDTQVVIVCIGRDLTERRRLEQQLIQSDKLSALGQLVAGVAHELNNPLTSISGYAQLLLRNRQLDEDARADLEQVRQQAERAGRIVRNLLMFAREHKPERLVVQINDVVHSALALQVYQLRVDNIAVKLELDPDLPSTVADPHQLQQVLLNLITNARQAMNEIGGGTLTIRTTLRETLDGQAIEIAVTDTGVGIPKHHLDKIFNPFFTTKPVGQGTGLGLSICYGIIQEHQGQIWAESQVGIGTTIFIRLPLVTPQADNETPLSPAIKPESMPPQRVLVVDDEESVRRMLQRLLGELGHHVTTVEDVDAALIELAHHAYDLIITDLRMPRKSGFDLSDAISHSHPHLSDRIIFISGDTLSTLQPQQKEYLQGRLLSKPFSIPQLTELLRNLPKQRTINSPEHP